MQSNPQESDNTQLVGPERAWDAEVAKAQANRLASTRQPQTASGKCVERVGFEELRRLVGRAFAGHKSCPSGEPLTEWLFKDFGDAIKSHQEKVDIATFLLSFYIHKVLTEMSSKTFGIQDGKGCVAAVALVTEENRLSSTFCGRGAHATSEGRLAKRLVLRNQVPSLLTSPETQSEAESLGVQSQDLQFQLIKLHNEFGPPHAHWYIRVFATDPGHQRKGVGAELMDRIVQLADSSDMDCYVEAGSEKIQRFYEHFGFEVVGRTNIENKASPSSLQCSVLLMVREHQR